MRQRFRHTKIVCTLGPATDAPSVLERLIEAGVDVVRLNAAHGSEREHAERIRRARRIARSLDRALAILLDLPGPKFRLGSLAGGSKELRRGRDVVLTGRLAPEGDAVPVDVPGFTRHVEPGQTISLSDGSVRLTVRRIEGWKVRCRVVVGGTVRSGSGVNLPDTDLSIRIPTADDARWLRFARAHAVDWIGVSFVRGPSDVVAVRRRLGAGNRPLVMAKIEKRQALEALEAIAREADGVMVARGDLGVETPLAEVPVAQKRIIAVANAHGRPVVTATQMLESMVEDPSPTRAEVGDVANAVLDGTDAVMLSAETAIGRHPLAAVRMLAEVIAATERVYRYGAALGHQTSGSLALTVAAQA
ncbi:MAG: pyruvate kinase, partial [Candidatus Binatia bacterium]